MMLAQTIYEHSLKLPETAAHEVLDFIDFLKMRSEKNAAKFSKEESQRKAALAKIAAAKVDWNGKPIANRDALYDEARG